MTIRANDPTRKTWVEGAQQSDFPLQNLPFGIFKTTTNPQPRIGSAIGQFVVDLAVLNDMSLFDDLDLPSSVFRSLSLNAFMALGKTKTRAVRERLADILDLENAKEHQRNGWHFLHDVDKVTLLRPVDVPNYTDFYSSIEHATNVGTMFRDPNNALLPNWRHLPVGYHGRASSIVVSGTPIHRPKGQTKPNDDAPPVFGPSRLLDFELEMGFVIGTPTELGDSVSTAQAEDYIFGLSLFNDWSARDIQKWEYVPLGPFLAKNFASTMSPWIITLDALEPFRVSGPTQDPEVLPYLKYEGAKNYNIDLEAWITAPDGSETRICQSNFKYMYWNMCQQLAHHTVNGCNLCTGDLYASGTISGPTPDSYGSMLELSWRGSKPIKLVNGEERKFIQDGDTLTLKGFGRGNGLTIGFGEVSGTILPAK